MANRGVSNAWEAQVMGSTIVGTTDFDYDAVDRALGQSEQETNADEKNVAAFSRMFNVLTAELIPPEGQSISPRAIGVRFIAMAYFCNSGAIESQPLSELAERIGCTKQNISRHLQVLRNRYGFEPHWFPTQAAREAQRKAAKQVWKRRAVLASAAKKILDEENATKPQQQSAVAP